MDEKDKQRADYIIEMCRALGYNVDMVSTLVREAMEIKVQSELSYLLNQPATANEIKAYILAGVAS